jgi:lipopolysaccharide transport system ATP-binding protein
LRVGETNDRTVGGVGDVVYSLRDVGFSVEQGQTVGVIGRNGAGKSTLLKVLSRVTSPTAGEVRIRGRIASLLEVGTGFHPELTGRENIYLNGAILGMRKREIRSRFDEIVAFSGVERYIDTPVKRYSSGMYVRLAFAVAAHLESEILIVDEVLAVGDAEFQRKCLGKMRHVSREQGRTVLFVSHNMASVKSLCQRGILLQNGSVTAEGPVADVIDRYLSPEDAPASLQDVTESMHVYATGKIYFRQVSVGGIHTDAMEAVPYAAPIHIRLLADCRERIRNMFFDIKVVSREGLEISISQSNWPEGRFHELEPGLFELSAEIENTFQPGHYYLTVGAHEADGTTHAYLENIAAFEVLEVSMGEEAGYEQHWKHAYFRPRTAWQIDRTDSVTH